MVRAPEGERYFPGVNISGEPEDYFRMAPEDWLQAEMQGEIVALVHSHPGGLPWLSEADRRLQVQSDLPWWLVCRGAIHKFRCVPHLTGRRFEHGVTDCYTLFRDAYHLAGIEMPNFHRGDDWWRHGQNLYLDNMEATGFYRVALTEAQPGDVLLCCFGSSGTITVRVYDDQPFDRQIVIPAVAFSGAKHEKEHTDIYSSCRLIVRKNGAEIYNRTALDNTLIYSGVIDMPAGHGHMTLEFSVSAWLVNNWYEFTDALGLITSFSYANAEDEQKTRYSDTRWHEDSVRNRWFSVMAGPSVRVNEWFSAYAMVGVAYSRVSTFSGDYLRVTDNKGKTHDVLTGSDDGRHSNTSLAWGAGVQFNPTESVTIDLAYEGSGSGDWRTDAFIVGIGYRF